MNYWLLGFLPHSVDLPRWMQTTSWNFYVNISNEKLKTGDIVYIVGGDLGVFAWGYVTQINKTQSDEQTNITVSGGIINFSLITLNQINQSKELDGILSFPDGNPTYLTNRQIKIFNTLISQSGAIPPPRNQQFILNQPVEQAESLKAELDSLRPLDAEAEARIMQKFRLDWNYHSNHLEGTQLTYGETKALLLFGITAQGKPLKDHLEITGHNEAIELVTDVIKDERPLTESFIRELHTLLLKEPYYVDAVTPNGQPTKRLIEIGKYKSHPNHVLTQTGATFYFATPEETPSRMSDLINWYRTEKDNLNPIILAAEFHYKFILIHPFDDGNGRLARILMNFILMNSGYPPVIIKTEDKQNYLSVLQQADAGILEPFVTYIANNLLRSLEIMIKGAKGESIEEPEDLNKELALLEQKFRNLGTRIQVTKSLDVVTNIIDTSIKKLVNAFIEKGRMFDRFYLSNKFQIAVNDKFVLGEFDNAIHYAKLEITDHPNLSATSLRLVYSYEAFTQSDIRFTTYNSEIRVDFNKTDYVIVYVNGENDIHIRKLYDEAITENEIKQLMDSVANIHKNFLEKTLNRYTQN